MRPLFRYEMIGYTRMQSKKSSRSWKRSLGVAVVLTVLTSPMSGCNDGTTSNESKVAAISVGDFPDAVAHAICDGLGPCCKEAGVAFDLANCLSEAAAGFRMQIDSATAQKYVPAAGGACVAALRTEMASCGGDPIEGHSCDWDLLVGTLPPGSSCHDSKECLPPATCFEAGLATGVCVATDSAGEGEPCAGDCAGESGSAVGDCSAAPRVSEAGTFVSDHVAACFGDKGLHCGTDAVCHSAGKLGEPCVPGYECVPGTTCDSQNTCVREVKAKLKPPFAACTSNEECATHACLSGKCRFDFIPNCAHPFASQPAN
jgi:hypothetical protein